MWAKNRSLAQKQEFETIIKNARRLTRLNVLYSVMAAGIMIWATIWLASNEKTGLAVGAAIFGLLVLLIFLFRAVMENSFLAIHETEAESGVNLLYAADDPALIEAYIGDDFPARILGTDGLVRVPKIKR